MHDPTSPTENDAGDQFAKAASVLARPDVRLVVAKVSAGQLAPSAIPANLASLIIAVADVVKDVAYRALLKEEEAARRLNCSVKTLQNHRSLKRGIKPVRPLGANVRLVRYDPLQIAAAQLEHRIDGDESLLNADTSNSGPKS